MTSKRAIFSISEWEASSLDYEGVELPNAEAAYEEAVGALAETIRDGGLEGATAHRFMIEVHDDISNPRFIGRTQAASMGGLFHLG